MCGFRLRQTLAKSPNTVHIPGAISLIFIFATAMHLLFGYSLPKEFLAIPIVTLFTLTQLRATMPGVPPFGMSFLFLTTDINDGIDLLKG